MKRGWLALLLAVLLLTGCVKSEEYAVRICIPAGSQADFAFSEAEILPAGETITLSVGAGLTDTRVVLRSGEDRCEPIPLPRGRNVKVEVEPETWYQVGVAVQNGTDQEVCVTVNARAGQIRLP